jgi:hypothetical protein
MELMATTLSQGGTYRVQQADNNIYVQTTAPVMIVAPMNPAVDQSFRVVAQTPNPAIMMSFTPNSLNKFGQVYSFGQGMAAILFLWDGVTWNAC